MARGYSLLEMMVVLAIMGLIAVLALPALTGAGDRVTLTADARAIATQLRALREEAQDRQSEITLTPADLNVSAGTQVSIGGATALVIDADGSLAADLRLTRNGRAIRVVVNRLTGRITVEDAP